MAIREIDIDSISSYLDAIRTATAHWYFPRGCNPWFRGQTDGSKPPIPSVFRKSHKEQDLVTFFVQRAGMYKDGALPQSPAQWLSLMQHVGLPTRLLDWTESALAALYFAVNQDANIDSAVWVLDSIELNKLSGIINLPSSTMEPVADSYRIAFSINPKSPSTFPIAVAPTHVHVRMAAQRGYFTIHGTDKRSFVAQFEHHKLANDRRLIKMNIRSGDREHLKRDLGLLGIKQATLFPDLDGLAAELADTF
jgi:hypothetical protein